MSMGFIKDFQGFAVKGNLMDMTIGIIIGASFNKVIYSLPQLCGQTIYAALSR